MAKSRKRSQNRSARRSRGRARGRTRTQKGGSNFPPSAWGWQLNNLGDGWTQFMNSLTLQPGQNLGAQQSNAIVPQGNLNAQNQQPHLSPNLETQKGGKSRSRKGGKSRSRKGGMVNEALVPLTLLALQQKYGKKGGKSRSRKGGMVNEALVPLTLLGLQQTYGKKSRKN